MNVPEFKIHGIERRKLKKELSELKSFLKNFWHYHQLDKDMCSFYGGTESYPMTDDKAQLKYDQTSNKIKELENMLSIKY